LFGLELEIKHYQADPFALDTEVAWIEYIPVLFACTFKQDLEQLRVDLVQVGLQGSCLWYAL
jgi:hypothetical protein